MPDGLANLLSDRQQFLDLTKYLIEVAEGGPRRAKELRPAQTAFVLPEYEKDIDHAGLIRGLDDKAFKRGEAIYTRVCANCHGTKDQAGSLPTSPRFAAHTFKNGSDPHGLYRTLTHGYNQMAPQTWMVPRQKYDVVHYLREAYLKPHNPTQYTRADDGYLAKLPKGTGFGPAPASVEPWMAMDYGPSLMNTYEVGRRGRTSRTRASPCGWTPAPAACRAGRAGRCSTTTRCGSRPAWAGDGFIDWKGIHFNGQHQVHPKTRRRAARREPGRAGVGRPRNRQLQRPATARARQAALRPTAPRAWARFQGTYAYGDQTVIAYTVGDASDPGTRGGRGGRQEGHRVHPHAGGGQVVPRPARPHRPGGGVRGRGR